MGNTLENKNEQLKKNPSKHICIGLLAHVDAGKTTLTETLLFNNRMIRRMGRVDHRNTFLDTDPIERKRGITVSSKQARIISDDCEYLLLDTPGHADLVTETERSLWVLDYALLLISAQEGVTSHTKYLWKMLETYNVPTFIFINKTDSRDVDRDEMISHIKEELSTCAIDFTSRTEDFDEQVAFCDEKLLDRYISGEEINEEDISLLISERKLFPVYHGSALKNTGVTELFDGLKAYTREGDYKESLSGKVYKITRDEKENRLAWIKITGGRLKVKQQIKYLKNGEEIIEKADQIRLYSGSTFSSAEEAVKGMLCTVTGFKNLAAGDAFGDEHSLNSLVTEPILTYEIEHDESIQTIVVYTALKKIEEEEPKLSVVLSDKTGRISVKVMGKVQMEILKDQMKSRFGMDIDFSAGTILYKETVKKTTEGVGHFEPLRHYAEVRLLIEPLERGSGVVIENKCKRDELDIHWQKLIMSHLGEKIHTGVLTDSELTDIRISLMGGRAHTKHTEPGDFRQAAFRALRQGLMENVNVLLEPYFKFVITVPEENVGRVLYDLDSMDAENDPPVIMDKECRIFGKGPAAKLGGYQEELISFTSGRGRVACTFAGYEECADQDNIVEQTGYDAQKDTENPSSSVFCSHGAGVIVPWYNVKDRMHTECSKPDGEDDNDTDIMISRNMSKKEEELSFKERGERAAASEKELEEIFARTYGQKGESRTRPGWRKARREQELFAPSKKAGKPKKPGKDYLLVDGYNIIFAWDELKELAAKDIGAARDKLTDILSGFAGMMAGTLILVFDAYKVHGGKEEVSRYHNIYVVYTRESETADQYIEKTVHDLGKNNNVTVATSDGLEQIIVMGEGAVRMSAAGLLDAVKTGRKQLEEDFLNSETKGGAFISELISTDISVAEPEGNIEDEKGAK